MTERTRGSVLGTLDDVLASAKEKDYAGYGKFDALESPVLSAMSMQNRWLRILITQAVKECPFHIRPLLGVRTSRNPKGIALFARALLSRHEAAEDGSAPAEVISLLDWLLSNPSPAVGNLCWGYNFIWQSPLFLQDRNEPNVIVTMFAGEALVHGYRVTGESRFLDAAMSVGRFILDDVPVLHDGADERAIAYVLRPVKAVVLNNNALAGAFLAKLWKETGEDRLLVNARRLITYTVNRRTDYGAWYYTHPAGKSHITHDNYHTGGILDALREFGDETGDDIFESVWREGIDYYARNLFEPDGAPRWMSARPYPRDVHGAAQGIITFAKAAGVDTAFLEQALRIERWTAGHLYRPETRDYIYREGRFMKWNYSLMRWCNAWMARALGELALAL